VVSGKGIDEIYEANNKELLKLKDENEFIKKELEQLKILNSKLVERNEFLQQIIEKEASANTFVYNYPPK
jgi:hypothetical protein